MVKTHPIPSCLALVLAIAPSACTDDVDQQDPGGEGPPAVHWDTCPPGFESECSYVSVPLDYDAPDGQTIDILISRRPAPAQPADAQLWLVMGGPGNSGHHFVTSGILDQLSDALPNTDLYIIEHRGVGYSAPLACPKQQSVTSPGGPAVTEDEIPACAQSIDDEYDGGLASFTVSNAARDIQRLLTLNREEGQRQLVYGVSYGTYLVHRFLQHFPDEVDGVILDSVVAPDQRFTDYDYQADPVVMRQAARCAARPTCSDKLGDDPWETIRTIVKDLEDGHCAAAGLTGEAVSPTLWTFIDIRELREMLFPLLYRLSRCEPADVEAVGHAFAFLQALMAETPEQLQSLDTLVATFHLATTEFVRRPFSSEDLMAICGEVTFCAGVAQTMLPYFEHWPVYDEPLLDTWLDTDTPILAFNGDMDVKTTVETASRITDHIDGPHQNFYAFPDAPHFLLATSVVKSPGAPTCALQMMVDFIADPLVPPNDGCLDQLLPFDPGGTPAQAAVFFGTSDLWENAAEPSAGAAAAPSPADWRRAAERLRRHGLRR